MPFEHATSGEARVASTIVERAIAKGWTISVYDGGEWTVKQSTETATVCEALASTGEDRLSFRLDGVKLGSFYLVWGNADDGSELIADHTETQTMRDFFDEISQACGIDLELE